jgi:hypothetical protein
MNPLNYHKHTSLGGYVLKHLKTLPGNPRFIKDEKFMALVESLKKAPWMMELRPIIIDEEAIVLGGNRRKRALEYLGYKEVPGEWVKPILGLTPEQKKEFIIKDNVSFGDWDFDLLANGFDEADLLEWGVDIPEITEEDIQELKPKEPGQSRQHFAFSNCDTVCRSSGVEYFALFRNNEMDLEALKTNKKNALIFTAPLYEYLTRKGIKNIVIAPPGSRSEKNGFNFLQEVVKPMEAQFNFISPFVNKNNRISLSPDWDSKDLPKKFIILDDITTRGTTLKKMTKLLPGYQGLLILITNH